MSTLKLLLGSLGLRFALMLVVVANALLLARSLGPQKFGEYFLFLKVVSVLAALADFGLSQSVNAFFGRHREWGRHLHRTVLLLVPAFWLGTTIVAGGILWLAGDTLLPNLSRKLMWMAFAILPLSLYANVWNSMMIGMGRVWRVTLLQIILCSVSLMLTLIFVVGLSGGVLAAVSIYSFLMLAQLVAMMIMALRANPANAINDPPVNLAQQMLHFGMRGYLGSLSSLLWMRVPIFLLNATHGAVAVGIFSVAQQIVERLLLPVQTTQDVIYQKMSVLSSSLAASTINRYLRVTWWAMVILAIVGIMLTPWAVLFTLGTAYTDAIPVGRVLLLGVAFMSIPLLLDAYFLNQLHRPGLVSILAWVNVLIGLSLAAFLIPPHAAEGAAWALLLTQILSAAIYLCIYLRMTGTSVAQLIWIHSMDVTLIRQQAGALLWPKDNRA